MSTTEHRKRLDVAAANHISALSAIQDKYPDPMMLRYRLKDRIFKRDYPDFDTDNPRPKVVTHEEPYTYDSMDNSAWVVSIDKNFTENSRKVLESEFYEVSLFLDLHPAKQMTIRDVYVFTDIVRSSSYTEKKLVKVEPSVTTILAMDAPVRQQFRGIYTDQQIQHLAIKSYTGFSSCVSRGINVINTDNWEYETYNRRDVVYFIQLMSAWLAGIQVVSFWSYTEDHGVDRVMDAYRSSLTPREFLHEGSYIAGVREEQLEHLYNRYIGTVYTELGPRYT